MHDLTGIPCIFMRGGTSRGPYFRAADLPADPATRDRVLLAAMGSPDLRQIDGLGGADTLTSKVAIVSKSTRPGVDVDYLFAQVDVGKPIVDTNPSCGNMLAGVAPFALETGMFPAQDGETRVMIYNVNTEARIEAIVQTPGPGRATPATRASTACRARRRRSCSTSWTWSARSPARCCRPETSATRSTASTSPASTSRCR